MISREQPERLRGFLFRDDAVKVLEDARQEAVGLVHNYIGTEHILLGCIHNADPALMRRLGLTIPLARKQVEDIIGRGDRLVVDEIGLTPRAKKIIEWGIDEAKRFHDESLEPDHILLGVVREGEGIAAAVIENLGVSLDKVRYAVLEKRRLLHPISRLRFFLADPHADEGKKQSLTILLNGLADVFVPYDRDQNTPAH